MVQSAISRTLRLLDLPNGLEPNLFLLDFFLLPSLLTFRTLLSLTIIDSLQGSNKSGLKCGQSWDCL